VVQRYKQVYAAVVIHSLITPNLGTSLRVQHLLLDDECKEICTIYEHFMWLSKQTAVASLKITLLNTIHDNICKDKQLNSFLLEI
jgi:hypothetical protein